MKSFLFVCLGLTITTIAFASARAIYERPGPPQSLNVDEIKATGCVISYREPVDNGGSPIVSYDIESRDSWSTTWKHKGTTPELTHEVINMTEGSEAKIRVRASNKYGKSDPIETAKYITFEKQPKPQQ